jgi:hypothetical protein
MESWRAWGRFAGRGQRGRWRLGIPQGVVGVLIAPALVLGNECCVSREASAHNGRVSVADCI